VFAALAGLFIVWQTAHYLLLFFAGILLALLLDAIASGIGRLAPIPRPIRLGMAILAVTGAFGAIGLVIPGIIEQLPQFMNYLGQWADWIRKGVAEWGPVQQSLQNGTESDLTRFIPDPAGLLGGAAQLLGGFIGTIISVALVIVFGIYLAAQPSRYYESTLSAFSPDVRGKLSAAGEDAATVLRRWLAGQLAMMVFIGLSSYIALTLLGVPLALTLSFIAGLTAFIPYIGPIMGGGTMILVAAAQDLQLGLAVVGFYIGLQFVESYLLTPLIQSRAIFVPPAVVILAQVVFGVLFGVLGIALATPLAAVVAVGVSRFYFHQPIDAD
jgi:predicted PurR-regulated permease PerM